MNWEQYEKEYVEWESVHGEAWRPINCFAVLVIIVVFWGVVIGGGFWLANAF